MEFTLRNVIKQNMERRSDMKTIEKKSPKETVRAMCMQCLYLKRFNAAEIKDCQGDHISCALFPYRLGRRISVRKIREHCLYCQGDSRKGVAECPTADCHSHPYRMGKNPALAKQRLAA